MKKQQRKHVVWFNILNPFSTSTLTLTLTLILTLILTSSSLFATSIEFGNHSIFYGIGQDTFSGYWTISSTGNSFSGTHIDTFETGTQLWLLHDALSVRHDEGDSLIEYAYHCRYYKKGLTAATWDEYDPVLSSPRRHESGFWYTSGYMDDVSLFNLPLDSGEYYLEFEHIATVVGTGGDTLTKCYILPDSADFKAEFTVIPSEQSGTEGASPIEISRFGAEAQKGKVKLDWVTESETGNSHFIIYCDGEAIGRVEGNGTTTEQHSYTFQDTQARDGMHRYAIADVSYGGVEELHSSVEVEVKAEVVETDFVLNKAYPNPFNPSVTINYQLSNFNKVSAFIYNVHGNMIKELLNDEMNAGSHTITWNADGMPSGVYVVKMIVGNSIQSQKIVLMK